MLNSGCYPEQPFSILRKGNIRVQDQFNHAKEKRVFRSCNSKKDRQYNGQTKKYKKTKIVDNILHRKLRIEQHELHYKTVMNSSIPKG